MSSRPRLNADEWRSYGRKVTYLAEMMADLGMPMAFHHHIGTIVESDQDVDNLMRHTGPAVGLLLDTGHSILAGGDPVRLSENHANRIVHFHGKDTRAHVLERAIAEDWSFLTAVMANVYTVPGDGNIDYYPILRSLHDTGYKGWLIVEAEQDLRMANPLTYARLGYGNLSRMAADAGLAVTT
jgi:inosose dehydratase